MAGSLVIIASSRELPERVSDFGVPQAKKVVGSGFVWMVKLMSSSGSSTEDGRLSGKSSLSFKAGTFPLSHVTSSRGCR